MSLFKKKLLGSVTAIALILGMSSCAPEPAQNPAKKTLKSSFNAVSHDLRLTGDDADIARLNASIALAGKSQTARDLFASNSLRGWTLSLEEIKEDDSGFMIAGFVSPSDKKIVLNKKLSTTYNTSTLIHEVAHIDQDRLGIGTAIYTHEGNIRILKIQEACSATMQTKAMWEIGQETPEIWDQYKQEKTWAAKSWERATKTGNAANTSQDLPTIATFRSFYEDPVSTNYEKNEAEHQLEFRANINGTDPDTFFAMELPIAATVASLTLHGISLPPSNKDFDLSSPFYAGCHKDTVKMLRAGSVSGRNLPQVRPDAPDLPEEDGSEKAALAILLVLFLGYAGCQGIQALVDTQTSEKKKYGSPAPKPKSPGSMGA